MHTTDLKDGHLLADDEITNVAVTEDRVVITKDADFYNAYLVFGAPPKVLYLTFGNISNKDLLQYFDTHFSEIVTKLEGGADIIEFSRGGYIDRSTSL
ncbi:DUF5615 family PIN-like protein [Neolewinella antarctica]|uniref:DUF5615 family PIN-like protein n=1 Tax=Neolewinella antarctica TaxID=442734 RepID=UPI00143A8694